MEKETVLVSDPGLVPGFAVQQQGRPSFDLGKNREKNLSFGRSSIDQSLQ